MKSYDLRREIKASATLSADGLATEAKQDEIIANQTDGTQKTQIVDIGGEAVTVTDGKLDVNAVIPPVEGGATEVTLADLLLFQKRTESILVSLLEEQQKTNKYLKKIYNPE